MKVDIFLKNVNSTVGEGPFYDVRNQTLSFVDIMAAKVRRANVETGEVMSHCFKDEGDTFCSAVLPYSSDADRCVVTNGMSLKTFDWNTKKTAINVASFGDASCVRANDAKCDPKGRLLFGTMGLETSPAVLPLALGCLFSCEDDFKVKTLMSGVDLSNGLDWTADNRTMFYADSVPGVVYAFDYDLECGSISRRRVVWHNDCGLDAKRDLKKSPVQIPDGLCLDHNDRIWLALFSTGTVVNIDPETGKIIDTIRFPEAPAITSCCFGGKNMDELFVTCGNFGETANQGSIFRVTEMPVKGRAMTPFCG